MDESEGLKIGGNNLIYSSVMKLILNCIQAQVLVFSRQKGYMVVLS